jgi:hypothetical protein
VSKFLRVNPKISDRAAQQLVHLLFTALCLLGQGQQVISEALQYTTFFSAPSKSSKFFRACQLRMLRASG